MSSNPYNTLPSTLTPVLYGTEAAAERAGPEGTSTTISSVEIVYDVKDHDVLLGRGAPIVNHVGNVRFRALIRARKAEYTETWMHQIKDSIARKIYTEICHGRNGRFLRQILPCTAAAERMRSEGIPNGTKAWMVATEDVAVEKIKQALRGKHSLPSPTLEEETALLAGGGTLDRIPTGPVATTDMGQVGGSIAQSDPRGELHWGGAVPFDLVGQNESNGSFSAAWTTLGRGTHHAASAAVDYGVPWQQQQLQLRNGNHGATLAAGAVEHQQQQEDHHVIEQLMAILQQQQQEEEAQLRHNLQLPFIMPLVNSIPLATLAEMMNASAARSESSNARTNNNVINHTIPSCLLPAGSLDEFQRNVLERTSTTLPPNNSNNIHQPLPQQDQHVLQFQRSNGDDASNARQEQYREILFNLSQQQQQQHLLGGQTTIPLGHNIGSGLTWYLNGYDDSAVGQQRRIPQQEEQLNHSLSSSSATHAGHMHMFDNDSSSLFLPLTMGQQQQQHSLLQYPFLVALADTPTTNAPTTKRGHSSGDNNNNNHNVAGTIRHLGHRPNHHQQPPST